MPHKAMLRGVREWPSDPPVKKRPHSLLADLIFYESIGARLPIGAFRLSGHLMDTHRGCQDFNLIFEPTCAYCTVGSSASVCLSACLVKNTNYTLRAIPFEKLVGGVWRQLFRPTHSDFSLFLGVPRSDFFPINAMQKTTRQTTPQWFLNYSQTPDTPATNFSNGIALRNIFLVNE